MPAGSMMPPNLRGNCMFSTVQVNADEDYDLKEAVEVFGRKPSQKGFSVSYQIDYKELTFGRELGKGGFGIVYQGTWRQHAQVAIKQLLFDDISPEASEEFDTESRVMARLRSPHIVQFYGYCAIPRRCIVMEYMPNGSLYSVLRNTKQPLDWSIRIRIAIDIASGISFLHQEHILHRDIKSLNVLLDASYGAKLTDFGLSKVKSESRSQSMATRTNREAVGTIAWMAPELFGRKAIYTQKSDIYSFGITLWELASRKIPFADAGNPALIPSWVSQGEREDIPKDCPQKLASLITACWDASPDKRPDANAVITYLKSDKTNFAQFLPLLAEHRASSTPQNAPQVPAHSLNSVRSSLDSLQISPPLSSIQKLNPPEQKNPPEPTVLTQFQVAKSSAKPNSDDLKVFLRLVTEGEQDKAEAMLKKEPALALGRSDVTDLSKRVFYGITGFQYAVWALDFHMWKMIRKYLPDDAALDQARGFETGSWVKKHGIDARKLLNDLVKAYEVVNHEARKIEHGNRLASYPSTNEANAAWITQVGGAQLLLPVHVVNEYCHPTRSFAAHQERQYSYDFPRCNNFKDASYLPRNRTIDGQDWFAVGRIGKEFAVYRADHNCARPVNQVYEYSKDSRFARAQVVKDGALIVRALEYSFSTEYQCWCPDSQIIEKLAELRIKQREELIDELWFSQADRYFPKVDTNDLNRFLTLVAEGEQDKAEAMLKINPTLALVPGEITDLSKRTFTGITGFQYAVWALDWHMWTMIRKYLPDEAAVVQAQGFETGSWVGTENPVSENFSGSNYGGHGVNARRVLGNLISAYEWTINSCTSKEEQARREDPWVTGVGRMQQLLPAHVVQEYCNSTLKSPNLKNEAVLPRSRTVIISPHSKEQGDWFNDKLGTQFAYYSEQHSKVKMVAHHTSRYEGFQYSKQVERAVWVDKEFITELNSLRVAQYEELVMELASKAGMNVSPPINWSKIIKPSNKSKPRLS